MTSKANKRGIIRKRRRHRAERRAATRDIRLSLNTKMLALKHPGWFGPDQRRAAERLIFR